VRTHLELAYLRRQALLHVRQLEAIFQAMTEGVFVFNAAGGMAQANAAGHALLDLLRDYESGQVATADDACFVLASGERGDVLPPLRLPMRRLLLGEVLSADGALNLLVHARDGQTRTIQVTGSPVRDEIGHITAAVAVCRDITEPKRTQDALARQERLYRTLVEHHPDLIARFDRKHQRIYSNSRVSALLGRSSERLLGTTFRDLELPEELSAAWDRNLARVFESGRPLTFETDLPLSAGSRMLQVRFAPEMAADGSVESVLSIAADITERKQVEMDLRHAKEVAETARGEAETAKRKEEQRRRAAESLRDVMAILNSQHALDDVLNYIVQQAAALLQSQAAVIYRVPATPDGVVALSAFSSSGTSPHPTIESYLPVNSATMRRMLIGYGAISFSDTSRLPKSPATSAHHEKPAPAPFVVPLESSFRAVLAGPIIVGGAPYGGLALLYHEPRTFTPDERALTGMLCDQVAVAIENANLRVQATRASVLAERTRLAREFHDAVTQTLFSASLVASALPDIFDADPSAGRQGLDNLRTLTHTALAEMRTLLVELRPAALTEKPLGDLLRQLGEAMSSQAQAAIVVEVMPGAGGPLPPNVQIALYRIAQEALNNAAKYAHARQVRVQLRVSGERIVLRIRDDGAGFATDHRAAVTTIRTGSYADDEHRRPPHAFLTTDGAGSPEVSGSGRSGIAIMRERARSVGASFALRSRAGWGTRIVVRWPGSGDAADVEEESESSVPAH
jgi:PAS domain S-box-containing protein